MFIADTGTYRIRKIDTNGIITTVVGGGNTCGSLNGDLDNCLPTEVYLINVNSIAINKESELFWGNAGFWVYKLDYSGIILRG